MEKTIIKKRIMTSYNVLEGGAVIAKADCWPANDGTSAYVIEVVPFENLAEKAGIRLNDREVWDDFYDSEESEVIPPEQKQARFLVSTILADLHDVPEEIGLHKKKDVFELGAKVGDSFYNLIMVYQFEIAVQSDHMDTGIFIHDIENHDTWHFPLGTNEGDVLEKISRSIGAYC